MITSNDTWGSLRVRKSRHQNKIDNTLRGHKVPAPVRKKIWKLIHDHHVALSNQMANDLNWWERTEDAKKAITS